jgi:hypothetical protein
MSTVTASQMRDKLLTVDALRGELAPYEPRRSHVFSAGAEVRWSVAPGWMGDKDNPVGDEEPVEVYLTTTRRAEPIQMTRAALLSATSLMGMSSGYAAKEAHPARLLQDALNYWYGDPGSPLAGKQFQVFSGASADQEQLGTAITRGSIKEFSNTRLLDAVLEQVEAVYGAAAVPQLLVDYKRHISLPSTTFRLIVPEAARVMRETGTPDDRWSFGITFHNSTIGRGQTSVDGYAFRWTCTNGMTTNTGGHWNRRAGQDMESVYAWAKQAVDDVLGGLEHQFDRIQETTAMQVGGDTSQLLQDLYSEFRLPGVVRDRITESMVDEENLTAYNVIAAITEAANGEDVEPAVADRLLEVGGFVPHATQARCTECHHVVPDRARQLMSEALRN